MVPEILQNVPWDTPMPQGAQTFFIALNSLILLAALVFIVFEIKRRNDLVPLYLLLGAALAIFYEPLGDMLVSALYPIPGQITWVSTFGRNIPLFIGILYCWYMSVPALYFLRMLDKGLTHKQLWLMYILTYVFATAYEILGVNMNAWLYYGEHSVRLFGVPLWATATYAGFSVVLCAGVAGFVRNFDSRYHGLLVLLVPVLLAGSHCALSLPAATVMFTEGSAFWLHAGAFGSILLSLGFTWFVGKIYCENNKFKVDFDLKHQLAD